MLRDIDQTTENLSQLRSYGYKIDIASGSKLGLSNININGKRKMPISPYVEFDTIGQAYTGHERYTIGAIVDNLLKLGDVLNVKYLSTVNDERSGKYSRSIIASWSMPIKYSKIGVNFSYSEYLSTIKGENQSFASSGNMTNASFFVQHMFFRNKNVKFNGFVNFNVMDSKNYINNTFSDVKSRMLMNLEVGFTNNLIYQIRCVFSSGELDSWVNSATTRRYLSW